jgi:anti-anti-sigma factor
LPERDPDLVKVIVVGELDLARDGELLTIVMALDTPAGLTIDFDLSEVSFVDSGGLASILKAKAYLEGEGCSLRIARPQKQFRRLIDLIGMTEVFTILPAPDET